MNKIVCVTGMSGSGKSVFSDFFTKKGYHLLRFGQITLDEIKRLGLTPSEANQKKIREDLRKKQGMDAFAKLNSPTLKKLLKTGNVVADGLYSWSEYKYLKRMFGRQMITVAVYAPPELRYERLNKRRPSPKDTALRNHHFSKKEAKIRDYNEIENIEKGGPIAMANYTLINTKDLGSFKKQLEEIYSLIEKKI